MDLSKLATIAYPKCPRCGGRSQSAEITDQDRNGAIASVRLRHSAINGHPHPYMQAANMAMSIGNQIYKRWPGGGLKQCTSCGHEFK